MIADEVISSIRRLYPLLHDNDIERIRCCPPFIAPIIPPLLPPDFRITLIIGPSGRYILWQQ